MAHDDFSASNTNSINPSYVVSYQGDAQRARAEEIAQQLELPLAVPKPTFHPFVLMLTADGLELHHHSQDNARQTSTVLRCDLISPDVMRRLASGKSQDLAKAVGIRSGQPLPYVLDATAGLGRDSFVLAHLGCQVQMVERHPLIAALLTDALARGRQTPQVATVATRLSLVQADACDVLSKLNRSDHTQTANPLTYPDDCGPDNSRHNSCHPDVIYLDPMYPATTKGALPKKEMQVLRNLLGADEVTKLLEQALALKEMRVVVKRPKHAPATPKPNVTFKGKQTRFDIYV
jgi:16S rRNA (guanine1516-N2)-methyltransferase